MIGEMPDDVISCLLLQIDNIEDVRRFFALNRRMHSFAGNQRLSLMWLHKNQGAKRAFSHAVRIDDLVFAHEMVPLMDADERSARSRR